MEDQINERVQSSLFGCFFTLTKMSDVIMDHNDSSQAERKMKLIKEIEGALGDIKKRKSIGLVYVQEVKQNIQRIEEEFLELMHQTYLAKRQGSGFEKLAQKGMDIDITYLKLSCLKKGCGTGVHQYKHQDCEGDFIIDKSLEAKCMKCKKKNFFANFKYHCGLSSHGVKESAPSYQAVFKARKEIARLVNLDPYEVECLAKEGMDDGDY